MNDTLIEEVKKRPFLWKRQPYHQHNNELKERAWNRIAEKLGQPKDEVKSKWKHLRDSFRRELKTVKKVTIMGEEKRIYTRTWRYFSPLLFLLPVTSTRTGNGILARCDMSPIEIEPINIAENSMFQAKTISLQEFNDCLGDNGMIQESKTLEDAGEEETKNVLNEASLEEFKDFPGDNGIFLENKTHEAADLKKENLFPCAMTGFPCAMTGSNYSSAGLPDTTVESANENQVLDVQFIKCSTLEKEQDNDDLLFFMSLIPHLRPLNSSEKLYFRSEVQNVLVKVLEKIKLNH